MSESNESHESAPSNDPPNTAASPGQAEFKVPDGLTLGTQEAWDRGEANTQRVRGFEKQLTSIKEAGFKNVDELIEQATAARDFRSSAPNVDFAALGQAFAPATEPDAPALTAEGLTKLLDERDGQRTRSDAETSHQSTLSAETKALYEGLDGLLDDSAPDGIKKLVHRAAESEFFRLSQEDLYPDGHPLAGTGNPSGKAAATLEDSKTLLADLQGSYLERLGKEAEKPSPTPSPSSKGGQGPPEQAPRRQMNEDDHRAAARTAINKRRRATGGMPMSEA